jgi:adenosine deaminase
MAATHQYRTSRLSGNGLNIRTFHTSLKPGYGKINSCASTKISPSSPQPWPKTSLARTFATLKPFSPPPDFARHGLETQKLTEAIRTGLSQVPDVEVALVADLVRDFGPEKGAPTLAEVSEVQHLGVVGIGIGGSEQAYPPEPFKDVYEEARRLGFHTSAHAGEAAGAESIWGAIRSLQVERIGHGTRAEEDDALLDYLAEHQIPLEMCPLSNVCTKVVNSIEEHPIRRYFEHGLIVTVNTDDPKMFGNSLAEEFWLLEKKLGFSRAEIQSLILQGIQAAWLPEEKKQQLIKTFRENPVWQPESRCQ